MARRFFVFWAFWCALTATLVTQAGTVKGTRTGIMSVSTALEAYNTDIGRFNRSEGYPLAPTLFSGLALEMATYSSGINPAGLIPVDAIGNQALTGSSAGLPDMSAPIRIDFASPRNIVGFEVLDLAPFPAERVQLAVFFHDGSPTQFFLHDDDDNDGLTPSFLGVISDELISAVEITSTSGGGAGSIAIDDLIYAVAVPEPAALLLLPGALLLLSRRRPSRR